MSEMKLNVSVVDGTLVAETVQDCTPIMERAKSLQNEGFHGISDLKYAAEIPNVIIERYCNENGISYAEFLRNKEHLKRVLNDPALAYFRIWKGCV